MGVQKRDADLAPGKSLTEPEQEGYEVYWINHESNISQNSSLYGHL